MAEHVTDDGDAGFVGHQQGVVPVTAQQAWRGGWTVGRRSLERGNVWQARDQQPLKLLCITAELVEQAGVVDRQASRASKSHEHSFVVGAERGPVEAIGDVQVSVDLTTDMDRYSKEAVHGGMAGREPGRVRVGEMSSTRSGAGSRSKWPSSPCPAGGDRPWMSASCRRLKPAATNSVRPLLCGFSLRTPSAPYRAQTRSIAVVTIFRSTDRRSTSWLRAASNNSCSRSCTRASRTSCSAICSSWLPRPASGFGDCSSPCSVTFHSPAGPMRRPLPARDHEANTSLRTRAGLERTPPTFRAPVQCRTLILSCSALC